MTRRFLTTCIDCGVGCSGGRCRKCYANQMKITRSGVGNPMFGKKPTEKQLKALDMYGNKFKKGGVPDNKESRFKKGRIAWNKGITGEDSHMYKGEK